MRKPAGLPPLRLTPPKAKWPVNRPVARSFYQSYRIPSITTLNPSISPFRAPRQSRSIFIQTENTPNVDVSHQQPYDAATDVFKKALKFLPNRRILPESLSSPYIEYLNPRSTLAPPYPSPLAAQLLSIDGIAAVFYGPDFITITKAADANWAHVKPEVFSLITEAVNSGERIVTISEPESSNAGLDNGETQDSLAYNEKDSEVVGMIKELLETRIRPAIQEDGGDVDFCGFENGKVLLKLRGACRTCDSSTVTLRNGIEGMLMHYVGYSPFASFPHIR